MSTSEQTILLYADIVGYTATLQANGTAAATQLKLFREVMQRHLQASGGVVLQIDQDYCMARFPDAKSALTCAEAMQQVFGTEEQVPVRIGLHAGPIISDGNSVFGKGIVVLRQVERVAVAGSIVMSAAIREQITDENAFATSPLGTYRFKQVATAQQLFALESPGLRVPEKNVDELKEPQQMRQMRWSQALKLFAGYLVAAWTLLQFIDWILTRYQLSPYWTDISLWLFVGIIPSLLIYLLHRERFHKRKLLLREKIVIPLNLLLVFSSLTVVYGGADLGSITRSVTFTDEDGQQITQTVVKPEFIQEVVLFDFEQLEGSDSTEWLGEVLKHTLSHDIDLDKYVSCPSYSAKEEMAKIDLASSSRGSYYIDGTYRVLADGYVITPRLKDKRNGKVVAKQEFQGVNVLGLIDTMSVFLRKEMGITPAQMKQSVDLNVEDYKSDKLEAIRYYVQGGAINFEKALTIDSTIAIAASNLSSYFHNGPRGQLEAKRSSALAMRHRKKLPDFVEMMVRLQDYKLAGKLDKAEQLVQLQLELNPSNSHFASVAVAFYTSSGQLEKAHETASYLYEVTGMYWAKLNQLSLALRLGKTDWVQEEAERLVVKYPKDLNYLYILAESYIHGQNFAAARETIQRMSLLKPEAEVSLGIWLDAVDYMEATPDYLADLRKFTGEFRSQIQEEVIEFDVANRSVFSRTVNYTGWYCYPVAKDSVVYGDHFGNIRKWKFIKGNSGYAYARVNGNYFWKQDSSIWAAEELIRNKEYAEARTAYQKAYGNHPEHFYLADALSHLDYLEQTPAEDIQKLYQQYAGQYGETKIWVEDGLLWYKRPGLPRRILRPVSDQEFITLHSYEFKYGFQIADSEVKGIDVYVYNNEKQGFELKAEWDNPRTGPLE